MKCDSFLKAMIYLLSQGLLSYCFVEVLMQELSMYWAYDTYLG